MVQKQQGAMSAEEGVEAIGDLVEDVVEVSASGRLDGFENIFTQLEDIVSATGVELPDFEGGLARLRALTETHQANFDKADAAMWAGDFARAGALMEAGAAIDLSDFVGPDDDDDGDDWDAAEMGEADAEIAFSEFDVSTLLGTEPDAPDLYADIVRGAPGAIEALIASGADLNAPSGPSRHTALFAALDAPGRSAATIAKLVDAGADPCAVHQLGDNALSWCMGYDHKHTVTDESERDLFAYLVDHGADPDHIITGQMAALHRGILQASFTQVIALLEAGADPDTPLLPEFEPQKLAGGTPLMLAAPKPEIFRLLLIAGADATVPDATGRDQLAFLEAEADAARGRIDPSDPWMEEHATALARSVDILRAHLAET